MKIFEKNRTRLLLISKDNSLRNNLITLLTAYGYYVDYADSRAKGLEMFKHNKQAIVILDVHALPENPDEMIQSFQVYRRDPIVLIAAGPDDEETVYPFLKKGVYDILHLPLRVEYLQVIFRRLVEHNSLRSQAEYMKVLLTLGLFSVPVWISCLLFALVK
jgi:DNA-binding NtrC family response regulator